MTEKESVATPAPAPVRTQPIEPGFNHDGQAFKNLPKEAPAAPAAQGSVTGRRSVIFVHGCFWHMHDCPSGRSTPVNNSAFWKVKREGNVARDLEVQRKLGFQGWRALVVWTCELRRPEQVEVKIRDFLLSSATQERDNRAAKGEPWDGEKGRSAIKSAVNTRRRP
jgi:DNA mismatch endonuclease Vsr